MEKFTQSDNNITIIIPARFASTRLEGKPLLKAKGKTIIHWVYEKAKQSKLAYDVVVATDDQRIYDEVISFGGVACMTSTEHKCGSDRLVEVLDKYPSIKVAVNVQGDEPMIQPESIDSAITALLSNEKADMATLIRVLDNEEEINNPNVVKVVTDTDGYAMYFSRSPIPYQRNKNKAFVFGHIGLYVYRRDSLLKMSNLPQSDLEKAESLEQLRALQNGMKIKTAIVDYKPIGIDTKEDYEEFLKSLS